MNVLLYFENKFLLFSIDKWNIALFSFMNVIDTRFLNFTSLSPTFLYLLVEIFELCFRQHNSEFVFLKFCFPSMVI